MAKTEIGLSNADVRSLGSMGTTFGYEARGGGRVPNPSRPRSIAFDLPTLHLYMFQEAQIKKGFLVVPRERGRPRLRYSDCDCVVATRKCRINCNEILSPPFWLSHGG